MNNRLSAHILFILYVYFPLEKVKDTDHFINLKHVMVWGGGVCVAVVGCVCGDGVCVW